MHQGITQEMNETNDGGDVEEPIQPIEQGASSTDTESTTTHNDKATGEGKSKESIHSENEGDKNANEGEAKSGGTATEEPRSLAPLSKRQTKRELKMARYLEKRKEKRALEKARKKAKRVAIREAGGEPPPKRPRKNLMSNSQCKQRIAVDLAYEKLMNEKQLSGVITQLAFCYAANRRAVNPTQLTFVNFTRATRTLFESDKNRTNWDVVFEERTLYEAYKREEIVYLTADSENILETLDPSKVYVIGGLLDHNSLKGLCLDVAVKEGVAHARLPIDDYVKMKTRKVLTINQVFEILLRYTENHSWKEAFFEVIPKRRMAEEEGERVSDNGNRNAISLKMENVEEGFKGCEDDENTISKDDKEGDSSKHNDQTANSSDTTSSQHLDCCDGGAQIEVP